MMTTARRLCAAAGLAAGLATAAAAQTVTRGPYLQIPTPDGMTIRWRTDVPTSTRVNYGASVGSLLTASSDPTPTTEHIVTLSGLSAGAQYFYSVGSIGGAFVGDDADHFFRTAPTVGTQQPIRIWATGDGGWTTVDSDANTKIDAYEVRDAYTAYNAGGRTDLFLLLGDNAYVTGQDSEFQAAFFGTHHDMIRNTPSYLIYGNHEEFGADTLTQTGPFFDLVSMPSAGQAGGLPSGSETYFAFDYGNVHAIVLDSELADKETSTNPGAATAMMTWLNAELAGMGNPDWVIAFWHRPPYTRGLFHDSDTELAEKWMRNNVLPVLESYGVDAVFCGHSHNYERSYLLDGHYGQAATFTGAYIKDSGNGTPNGDGPYRKIALGETPNAGAVYVVAGSSSERRLATLNHPAHKVNINDIGSLVIDIDTNTLTSKFLNGAGAVTDTFQIVKGGACPTTPAAGCVNAAKAKIAVKNNVDNAKDKFAWSWKIGNLTAVGNPMSQTDLAVCLYDANGRLLGGGLPRAGALWTPSGTGYKYKDKLGTNAGLQTVVLKPSPLDAKSKFTVKGKGVNLNVATLPATAPVTAQLINLDTNACWQSAFVTPKKNDAGTLTAKLP